MTIHLAGTPYLLSPEAAAGLKQALRSVDEHASQLRGVGRLKDAALRSYAERLRFEQVAESNALEGSTLSIGETEAAILSGGTITGLDPKFVADARNLDHALTLVATLARTPSSIDITGVKEVHAAVLEGHPKAGNFRVEPVTIRGSSHHPPRTWDDVMKHMEDWERWSAENATAPAIVRSAVLHAWLTHIHPFLDGNGRTARAIGNLELLRGGLPPIIIRKAEKPRYLDALSESDVGGNLSPFVDLVLRHVDDALQDLEREPSAPAAREAFRAAIENRLGVWTAAVELLTRLIEGALAKGAHGATLRRLGAGPTSDDFAALSEGRSISARWLFRIDSRGRDGETVSRLAWLGYRSPTLRASLPADVAGGPSILWSAPTPGGYPPWRGPISEGLGGDELTLVGERWFALRNGSVESITSEEIAARIASDAARLSP